MDLHQCWRCGRVYRVIYCGCECPCIEEERLYLHRMAVQQRREELRQRYEDYKAEQSYLEKLLFEQQEEARKAKKARKEAKRADKIVCKSPVAQAAAQGVIDAGNELQTGRVSAKAIVSSIYRWVCDHS